MGLTGNVKTQVIDNLKFLSRPVIAGAIKIYDGALINANAAGDCKLSSDTATEKFAGVAAEALEQDASALAADNKIKMIVKGSGKVVRMKLVGVSKANIDANVYASADDAVVLAVGNGVLIGVIVAIEEDVANYCFVKI